jgi:hypothetical protein
MVDHDSRLLRPLEFADGKIFLDHYPNDCPWCHCKIDAQFVSPSAVSTSLPLRSAGNELQIAFKCSNLWCKQIFIAIYRNTTNEADKNKILFFYSTTEPRAIKPKEFDPILQETFQDSEFFQIYEEASKAEQYGLLKIAGPGYRKAFETLLKDFLIHKNPEEAEAIAKEVKLQKLIQEKISDITIKNVAERTAWLGNDETHYQRKWKEMDLGDLKELIDLTVYFIQSQLKADNYILMMEKRPQEPVVTI